jgi:trans-2,3-dihydro-3-hydroxyanthranilate isomerase
MDVMNSYRYRVVDVFTDQPLEGNALAVFPDASGMDDATMQKIAKEMNLSETTFITPATRPGCIANVRIFAPAREMPFAGHPTIGTSFVLIETGTVARNCSRFALEEKVGAVPIQVETGPDGRHLIWFSAPPITWGKTFDRKLCAQVLGLATKDLLDLPPQLMNGGNHSVLIGLKDKAAVDRAWLDAHGMKSLRKGLDGTICVFVFAPTPEGAYSRMFAPEFGIAEDAAYNWPACGVHDETRSLRECPRDASGERARDEDGPPQYSAHPD